MIKKIVFGASYSAGFALGVASLLKPTNLLLGAGGVVSYTGDVFDEAGNIFKQAGEGFHLAGSKLKDIAQKRANKRLAN